MSKTALPARGRTRRRTQQAGAQQAGALPSIARWTVLCAAAEAIGMTAAAAAARTSQAVVGESTDGRNRIIALSLVVAGGLVEGIALGALQSAGLRTWLAGFDRTRWILVTTAVAGLGWAGASTPSVLMAGDESDGGPRGCWSSPVLSASAWQWV